MKQLSTLFLALAISLAASALGLGVNALRPGGISLVAVFPYEQDCPEKLVSSAPTVTADQAVRLVHSPAVLFLDARPAEAFAQEHIPRARSLPYSFVTPVNAATAKTLRSYRYLIIYCDSPGDRLASMLAEQLKQLGLTSIRILQGGWIAYKKTLYMKTLTGRNKTP